jgi:hypothetical protein
MRSIVSRTTRSGYGSTAAGGIDAFVGEQTRKHDDLDLVVAERQLAAAESALRVLGHGIGHHRHSRLTSASLEAAARLRAVRRVAVLKLIVNAIDTWFICRFGRPGFA